MCNKKSVILGLSATGQVGQCLALLYLFASTIERGHARLSNWHDESDSSRRVSWKIFCIIPSYEPEGFPFIYDTRIGAHRTFGTKGSDERFLQLSETQLLMRQFLQRWILLQRVCQNALSEISQISGIAMPEKRGERNKIRQQMPTNVELANK